MVGVIGVSTSTCFHFSMLSCTLQLFVAADAERMKRGCTPIKMTLGSGQYLRRSIAYGPNFLFFSFFSWACVEFFPFFSVRWLLFLVSFTRWFLFQHFFLLLSFSIHPMFPSSVFVSLSFLLFPSFQCLPEGRQRIDNKNAPLYPIFNASLASTPQKKQCQGRYPLIVCVLVLGYRKFNGVWNRFEPVWKSPKSTSGLIRNCQRLPWPCLGFDCGVRKPVLIQTKMIVSIAKYGNRYCSSSSSFALSQEFFLEFLLQEYRNLRGLQQGWTSQKPSNNHVAWAGRSVSPSLSLSYMTVHFLEILLYKRWHNVEDCESRCP